jgi:hypothetical protein
MQYRTWFRREPCSRLPFSFPDRERPLRKVTSLRGFRLLQVSTVTFLLRLPNASIRDYRKNSRLSRSLFLAPSLH